MSRSSLAKNLQFPSFDSKSQALFETTDALKTTDRRKKTVLKSKHPKAESLPKGREKKETKKRVVRPVASAA